MSESTAASAEAAWEPWEQDMVLDVLHSNLVQPEVIAKVQAALSRSTPTPDATDAGSREALRATDKRDDAWQWIHDEIGLSWDDVNAIAAVLHDAYTFDEPTRALTQRQIAALHDPDQWYRAFIVVSGDEARTAEGRREIYDQWLAALAAPSTPTTEGLDVELLWAVLEGMGVIYDGTWVNMQRQDAENIAEDYLLRALAARLGKRP